MPPRAVLLALLVLASGIAVGATATAQPTASITAADAQPIPEQQLTIEGATFTPATVSVHDPGDTLSVDITVSNDALYRVPIYNTQEQIVTQERRSSDATLEFDLGGYTAGTYMVTVVQDGTYLALHPLLVRGYDVSVDAPASAPADGTVTIDASVRKLRGETLEYVEVVVTDGDQRVRTRMSGNDGEYSATVDLTDLEPGSYEVYATIRGSTDAYGEAEFLGVNEGVPLELEAATPTPGGGGSGGGDDPTPTETPTRTVTQGTPVVTATSTVTASTPTGTPTATDSTATPTSATVGPTTSPTTTPTPTDDGVVTPASPPPSSSPTPTTGQPGFGPLALGLASALVALLVRRADRR